ncbi:MAG: ThiF family adenylyltransferase [Candidatus Uhrbacteria bacterium]|nr:ThiF family adenylyltransferase [Candidatus Uhrbacteria bacterium]
MSNYRQMFARNGGFISPREQHLISEATIAIAGVGGDGGEVAVMLARLGVQRFRIADPEVFEIENTNRQAGCNSETISRKKAEVIAEEILRINSAIDVTVYLNGIDDQNIAEFVKGATLVIDETEFTQHILAVMLARECRQRNIPVVTGFNVGFGCIVTTLHPRGMTLEKYLGLKESDSLEEIARKPVNLGRWIPRLPAYAHEVVFRQVEGGKISAPSVSPGVSMAAGHVITEVFNNLTNRKKPVYAPKVLWSDAMERKTKTIGMPAISFFASLARLVFRSRLGFNEPMDGSEKKPHYGAVALLSVIPLIALVILLQWWFGIFTSLSRGIEREFKVSFWVFAIGWVASLYPYWKAVADLFIGLYQGDARKVWRGVIVNRIAWFLPYGMVLVAGGRIPLRLLPYFLAFLLLATCAFIWRMKARKPPRLPHWTPEWVKERLSYDQVEQLYQV